MGGTETFFDVTEILRPGAAIRALPEKYSSFADEKFFVAVPITELWEYGETTEAAIMMETLGKSSVDLRMLEAVLKAAPAVYLWRGKATYTSELTPKNPFKGKVPEKFKFFPFIAVQIFTDEDFRRMGAAIDVLEEGKEARLEAMLETMAELREGLGGGRVMWGPMRSPLERPKRVPVSKLKR